MGIPRGIANNNPGNIIKTATVWRGQKPFSSDPKFCQFETIEFGYRALIKMLQGPGYISAPPSYFYERDFEPVKGKKVYGPLNTIDKILSKYCDDHTTASYIDTVEGKVGISRFTTISASDKNILKRLVMAISAVENGVPAVDSQVEAAFEMLEAEKKNPISALTAADLTSGYGPFAIVVALLVGLFVLVND